MTTSRRHLEAGDQVERAWTRLGVLFNTEPGTATPDLEHLLLDTARHLPENARLLPLIVTWLAAYSRFVARHRLARMVEAELEARYQPALGLLIEAAVEAGATRDLLIAAEQCQTAQEPHPLFRSFQGKASLEGIARENASALSRKWGVWAPEVERKPDAIRPVAWMLEHNPDYRDRIIRKGDLRVSILETLRRDVQGGVVHSESELARLSGATRTAVRKALAALVLEGAVTVAEDPRNDRDHPVALVAA